MIVIILSNMFFLNYLFALIAFVIIYLAERLVLFWLKKKTIWPLVDFALLKDAIAYSVLSLLLLGVLHIVFRKVNTINFLWLDAFIYIFIHLIKPYQIIDSIKNKEKISLKKNHFLGLSLLLVILLECFAFNADAYSDNKQTYKYQNFISEGVTSDGEIKENNIILKSKQYIIINTNQKDYSNLYLSFNNDDMNLYINIYEMKDDGFDYTYKKFVLIDPTIDAYGYISLDNMSHVESLKIEFDIDDSRYLNNDTKPNIVINGISFDAYFPLLINPLRLGGLFILLLIGFNFKKMLIDNRIKEQLTIYQKLEKVILFGGVIVFTYFIIQTLINSSSYFIKYDALYLGGTSSNNIYYQQFDAYVKGKLALDLEADPGLLSLENPYDPYKRAGLTVLWDHAFYNGKYYCYYGHAPIYLVMLPIYWLSRYVPTNLFVLQLGVFASIFTFLLAALQIIKLFIKKTNNAFLVLTLISMTFGSLLLTNNTYEYGGMVYRIPYAYANCFLFLTIYLFLKGYSANKNRFLYFLFTGLSLVFIVLSRPLEVIYLLLFIPIIIKMIKSDAGNIKRMAIDYIPAIGVVIAGAIIVCVMNYSRFGNILEFGEHYQLTVTDCTKNHLSIDGILPTIYHYYLQAPTLNKDNMILTYSYTTEHFDIHPYITNSVGLVFIPIALLMLVIPFIFVKEDNLSFRIFVLASPFVIFLVAFINYCFAGVCPRYLNDFAPWAALTGGLIGLKALEKDNGYHPVVPLLISVVLLINIFLTGQYHFIGFDGLRIGDFNGLLGIIKTITNQFNI